MRSLCEGLRAAGETGVFYLSSLVLTRPSRFLDWVICLHLRFSCPCECRSFHLSPCLPLSGSFATFLALLSLELREGPAVWVQECGWTYESGGEGGALNPKPESPLSAAHPAKRPSKANLQFSARSRRSRLPGAFWLLIPLKELEREGCASLGTERERIGAGRGGVG